KNAEIDPTSVATDISGNIYITGNFNDTITFGAFQLISLHGYSAFIVKYSPSGIVLWAKQSHIASIVNYEMCNSITTDKDGNAYISGGFSDSIWFDSFTLTTQPFRPFISSVFLVKYDSNGNVLWATQAKIP